MTAAGFLVFCIGQSIVLSTAGGAPLQVAAIFATGAACWAMGLVLIGLGDEFPLWVRLAGFVTAVLFALTSIMILAGAGITAVSLPLPMFV